MRWFLQCLGVTGARSHTLQVDSVACDESPQERRYDLVVESWTFRDKQNRLYSSLSLPLTSKDRVQSPSLDQSFLAAVYDHPTGFGSSPRTNQGAFLRQYRGDAKPFCLLHSSSLHLIAVERATPQQLVALLGCELAEVEQLRAGPEPYLWREARMEILLWTRRDGRSLYSIP